MANGPLYSERERTIIRREMQGFTSDNNEAMKHCRYISENLLPHRSAWAIRQRWFKTMLGNGGYHDAKDYEDEIQDLADLLSPEQRKRLRTRVPSVRGMVVKTK